jgi:hypothetical protein
MDGEGSTGGEPHTAGTATASSSGATDGGAHGWSPSGLRVCPCCRLADAFPLQPPLSSSIACQESLELHAGYDLRWASSNT